MRWRSCSSPRHGLGLVAALAALLALGTIGCGAETGSDGAGASAGQAGSAGSAGGLAVPDAGLEPWPCQAGELEQR